MQIAPSLMIFLQFNHSQERFLETDARILWVKEKLSGCGKTATQPTYIQVLHSKNRCYGSPPCPGNPYFLTNSLSRDDSQERFALYNNNRYKLTKVRDTDTRVSLPSCARAILSSPHSERKHAKRFRMKIWLYVVVVVYNSSWPASSSISSAAAPSTPSDSRKAAIPSSVLFPL